MLYSCVISNDLAILNDLSKYSMPRSIARSLCDSWSSWWCVYAYKR